VAEGVKVGDGVPVGVSLGVVVAVEDGVGAAALFEKTCGEAGGIVGGPLLGSQGAERAGKG
jgi:hypothetical protein